MPNSRVHSRAFTVLELLISISIVALLVSILLPALSAGRHSAKDLECRAGFRAVTQAFIQFADDSGAGLRGESQALGERFLLEDFQESVYGIDEFWQGSEAERYLMDATQSPLMCPEERGVLERRAGLPCSAGAVGPATHVSAGFNKRLEKRTRLINGRPFPGTAYLSSRILQFPNVPLVLDVDGAAAVERNVVPFYSAPPVLTDKLIDIYESGTNWFPAFRHRGHMNVGFVGGHVLSSSHPTTEPWWRWDFDPGS